MNLVDTSGGRQRRNGEPKGKGETEKRSMAKMKRRIGETVKRGNGLKEKRKRRNGATEKRGNDAVPPVHPFTDSFSHRISHLSGLSIILTI
jgi:hypothetical protein